MLKQLLLCLWQLPQSLFAGLLLMFMHPKFMLKSPDGIMVMFSDSMSGGISLGQYCILHTHHYTWEDEPLECDTVRHELGHCRQSRILGPLYLFVIGLPSLLWAWCHSSLFPNVSYYAFYTEKWADKLGNVKR